MRLLIIFLLISWFSNRVERSKNKTENHLEDLPDQDLYELKNWEEDLEPKRNFAEKDSKDELDEDYQDFAEKVDREARQAKRRIDRARFKIDKLEEVDKKARKNKKALKKKDLKKNVLMGVIFSEVLSEPKCRKK